ncbi:MAG TPA: hypothetical protein VK616_09805, partial [Flavitalea sp.]|nr:hypothetical protein [Flavitalea sp.]
MICCDNLIHPFQNDPGISQRQRVIDDLLSGSAQIDGRKTADLLDYFSQLSRHINFYDSKLNVSDWQAFFRKSIPFSLTGIIKHNRDTVQQKFDKYNKLFDKRPNRQSLQLIVHFIYYQTIHLVNRWHGEMKGSDLPVERLLEKMIRDKLHEPVKKFICLTNTAAEKYRIKKIDFNKLQQSGVWELRAVDLRDTSCFVSNAPTKRKRLIALRNEIVSLFPAFMNIISLTGPGAEASMELSLFPLKEEFQKKHSPHLALLFAFLKLFRYLQNDLNGFTKKHLDFFYQDILKLQPGNAVPDKAHITFEIQKQLEKFLIKKGIQVKDGKDVNKAEINFALNDEIVVNKASITDIRTLFLNNESVFDSGDGLNKNYVEGVYVAPVATMADGVSLGFAEKDPANWPTLGQKLSKYTDPETKIIRPYPNGRLGFILASPILLLNEGKRTVEFKLACKLKRDVCEINKNRSAVKTRTCCEDEQNEEPVRNPCKNPTDDELYLDEKILDEIELKLNREFYYISQELVAQAKKKGMGTDIIARLLEFLLESNNKLCYCPVPKYKYDAIVPVNEFEFDPVTNMGEFNEDELKVLSELFKPRRPLRVYFSGEKDWIEPELRPAPGDLNFFITQSPAGSPNFIFGIRTTLQADKPGVTFYNKDNLKEDFNTTLPLVRIELDDKIKLHLERELSADLPNLIHPDGLADDCCLQKGGGSQNHYISLYHFFRNVILSEEANNRTTIDVTVCGLKNFIVQFESTPMDVNGPIYPWGPRPDVVDFNLVTTLKIYCITQEFIDDADLIGIHPNTKTFLEGLIAGSGFYKIGNSKPDVDAFLAAPPFNAAPSNADIPTLNGLFDSPKEYCPRNLIGPNFYIGSKEIFCKKWTEAYINLNWRDKPVDFNEYYLAYWADPSTPPAAPPPGFKQKYGLDEDKFEINLSLLQDGKWKPELAHPLPTPPLPPPPRPAETTLLNLETGFFNRKLFPTLNKNSVCISQNTFQQTIYLKNDFFDQLQPAYKIDDKPFEKYDVNSRDGFLKINLQNQDFLHKDYTFVLARQMMALGKYPDTLLEGAVYREQGGTVLVFKNFAAGLLALQTSIVATMNAADAVKVQAKDTYEAFNSSVLYTPAANPPPVEPNIEDPPPAIPFPVPSPPPDLPLDPIDDSERDVLLYKVRDTYAGNYDLNVKAFQANENLEFLQKIYSIFDSSGNIVKPLNIPIPNEPWTPVIKEISIDYKATANIKDIDLIHLYPYEGTYKPEEIEQNPTLFPTFCDEGTLFLGMKDLVPGSNLNILFQLAEATADSESVREELAWYYLDNNEWKSLRQGFEVLDDATDGLTTSGIIKLALPANMTKDNTILPKDLHWIRASIPRNSRSVAETIGLHTQAILTVFTNEPENDKLRLNEPLAAGSITKLTDADPSVK